MKPKKYGDKVVQELTGKDGKDLDQDRPGTVVAAFQPIGTFGIGSGSYVRSTAIWVFDFQNNRYLIPLGLGIGKVFKVDNAITKYVYRTPVLCVSQGARFASLAVASRRKFSVGEEGQVVA